MKRIVYLLALIGLFTACGSDDKHAQLEKLKKQSAELNAQIKTLEAEIALEGDSTNAGFKSTSVAIETVVRQPFEHYVDVQGKIEGDQNVNVSAQMAGIVTRIVAKEGVEVREGQVLAELDDALLMKGMDELKSALAFATDIYDKQKKLWDQKIGSEVQFLTAKNNKESLEAKMKTLKEQLEMTKIKSPINGVVDAVNIKVGQAVSPGMPALRVVNLTRLKATAEISESYATKVRKGNKTIIYLPDLQKEISSTITYTSKVINTTTRTFSAEAELSSSIPDLRPNMIAVLKVVDYENDSTIVIPLNIIQSSGTSKYVYVVSQKDGKKISNRRDITIGQMYNGKVEVVKGLEPNDQIITSGYLDLAEGMFIQF